MGNESQSEWSHYGEYAPRNDRMAKFWLGPTIDYLEKSLTRQSESSPQNILDYGCSHFDLGMSLDACVDGYDPDKCAIEYAKRRVAAYTGKKNALTHNFDEIPEKKYSWIVASSVMQYFSGNPELEKFIENCASKWLIHGNSNVLITDVIPVCYSKPLDAIENILVAARGGFLIPMLKHLMRAALRPASLKLMRYDVSSILEIAGRHGFHGKVLEKNLTPSRRRYTVLLSKS
jgi:hypothetical protein